MTTGVRRFIEWLLPWFDPVAERARDARTEAIRQRSIAGRIAAERIRTDYLVAAERARRRQR